MPFIEVKITSTPEVTEMLIAELVEIGYDSFQELEEGLDAYVEEEDFF